MAANTKIPVGSIGQLQNLAVQGVEDRAHLRIRVLRDGPLAEMIGVAGGAGIGRRKTIIEKHRQVRRVAQLLNGLLGERRLPGEPPGRRALPECLTKALYTGPIVRGQQYGDPRVVGRHAGLHNGGGPRSAENEQPQDQSPQQGHADTRALLHPVDEILQHSSLPFGDWMTRHEAENNDMLTRISLLSMKCTSRYELESIT